MTLLSITRAERKLISSDGERSTQKYEAALWGGEARSSRWLQGQRAAILARGPRAATPHLGTNGAREEIRVNVEQANRAHTGSSRKLFPAAHGNGCGKVPGLARGDPGRLRSCVWHQLQLARVC